MEDYRFIYVHTVEGKVYPTRAILPSKGFSGITFTNNDDELLVALDPSEVKEITLSPLPSKSMTSMSIG